MKESIPLIWRRIPSRYRLEGTKCETCETYYFPPRNVCPKCRRRGKIVKHTFKGTGRIVSYTTIYVGAEGFERQVPYVLAIVELDEGPRLTAQIVDAKEGEFSIGDRVEKVFRRILQDDPEGPIHYGYKFRLLKEQGS